jgi:hypothetical protein
LGESFDLHIIKESSELPEGYRGGLIAAAVAHLTFGYTFSGGSDPQQLIV